MLKSKAASFSHSPSPTSLERRPKIRAPLPLLLLLLSRGRAPPPTVHPFSHGCPSRSTAICTTARHHEQPRPGQRNRRPPAEHAPTASSTAVALRNERPAPGRKQTEARKRRPSRCARLVRIGPPAARSCPFNSASFFFLAVSFVSFPIALTVPSVACPTLRYSLFCMRFYTYAHPALADPRNAAGDARRQNDRSMTQHLKRSNGAGIVKKYRTKGRGNALLHTSGRIAASSAKRANSVHRDHCKPN